MHSNGGRGRVAETFGYGRKLRAAEARGDSAALARRRSSGGGDRSPAQAVNSCDPFQSWGFSGLDARVLPLPCVGARQNHGHVWA
jgi:hypothetical protein